MAKDDIREIELHTGTKIDMALGDYRSATVALDRLLSKGEAMTPLCGEMPDVNLYSRLIMRSVEDSHLRLTVEIDWHEQNR